MANYKKANGKASEYDAVITDPGYGKKTGSSSVKAKQVDNSAVSARLNARKPVNNTLSAKTSNMKPVAASGTAASKRNAALSKLTNKASGNKYGQGSQVGLLPDPTKNPIKSPGNLADYKAGKTGQATSKTGKPTITGNYGSGADTGLLKGVGKASGKAPVVYETPGFKPAKKTSKK